MQTFLGVPSCEIGDVSSGNIVVIGASDATPYERGKASHAQGGPAAIRAASQRYATWHEHYDFDAADKLLEPSNAKVVDVGDVECNPTTPELNREKIEGHVTAVLSAEATPLVIGGDDSVPIPVLSAYQEHGPIWVVQIDAHMDWRDERFGERLGWSSPMRRASEMGWVEGMVQIGIRGVGSAFVSDVRDAEAWGSKIVTAREVHAKGVGGALEVIPKNADVFVSLDLDALDPAFMPGVAARSPGGLNYWHIVDVFEGLAARANIVGCNIVELAPQMDPGGVSAMTAARIACNAIASTSRSRRRTGD